VDEFFDKMRRRFESPNSAFFIRTRNRFSPEAEEAIARSNAKEILWINMVVFEKAIFVCIQTAKLLKL
jgi:hypothetical protein